MIDNTTPAALAEGKLVSNGAVIVIRYVKIHKLADGSNIVFAGCVFSPFPRRTQSRHQYSCQNSNYRDDDQQLDQSK